MYPILESFRQVYDRLPTGPINGPVKIQMSKFSGLEPFKFGENEFLTVVHRRFPDEAVPGMTYQAQIPPQNHWVIAISDNINTETSLVKLRETIAHEFIHVIDFWIARMYSLAFGERYGISTTNDTQLVAALSQPAFSSMATSASTMGAFKSFANLDPHSAIRFLMVSDQTLENFWKTVVCSQVFIDQKGNLWWKEAGSALAYVQGLRHFAKMASVREKIFETRFAEAFPALLAVHKAHLEKRDMP